MKIFFLKFYRDSINSVQKKFNLVGKKNSLAKKIFLKNSIILNEAEKFLN